MSQLHFFPFYKRLYYYYVAIVTLSIHITAYQTSSIIIKLAPRPRPQHFLHALYATSTNNQINPSDWDFLNDVFLITTSNSPENTRLTRTMEELNSCNLRDKVIIKQFAIDNEDRIRGCYTSHMKVLREIQAKLRKNPSLRKSYRALIVEDNLERTPNIDRNVLRNIGGFLDNPVDWDVFHLAYMM